MIVVMKVGSPEAEIARLTEEFTTWGLSPEKIVGKHKVVIGLVGETAAMDPLQIQESSNWIEQLLLKFFCPLNPPNLGDFES